MENISVEYLGLRLKSPIVVSSSPFTASADKIVELERHGAGAVVLKSIFEEQIIGESSLMERYDDYPEAADYLRTYVASNYMEDYLRLIVQTKSRVSIPVIASINCTTNGDWADYAKKIESAGADAVELNIFTLPTDSNIGAEQIEKQYMHVVEQVVAAVSIPVSVKLSMRFTNILSVIGGLYNRKVKGVVMYNRLFEPDIDIENMSLISSDTISTPSELRNALRTIAIASAQLPLIDIAVSSGVHNGAEAVKAILAGAKAVQVCSAMYLHGLDVIGSMNGFIADWATRHGYDHVSQFCGAMNYKGVEDSQFYQRVQYMKYFPKK